jgi:heme/copper-type cytochrome/quinol oxidase subunit 2
MLATVRAEEPAEFEAWLAQRRQLLAEAQADAAAERKKLDEQQGPAQVENP